VPETEMGEENNEGLVAEAIAEEVQEGASYIPEPVAEAEAVEDVYEAEPVETYEEEYVEESESDVVTAVVEEAEENAVLRNCAC
jgi:methanogenic corrinoid protein MtbC1